MNNQCNGLAAASIPTGQALGQNQRHFGQRTRNSSSDAIGHRDDGSTHRSDKILEWPEGPSALDCLEVNDRLISAAAEAPSGLSQDVDVSWESTALAHELRQPLSAIVSNAEACLRWMTRPNPDQSAAQESIKRVIRDARAAAELMEAIRGLCRGAKPKRDRMELNAAIVDVLSSLRDRIDQRAIKAEADVPKDPFYIYADRVQFRQVLHNLVVNAIEAMEEIDPLRRLLCVRSSPRNDETILVTVEDSGRGLSDTERLFDPFFSTKKGGMGLGLWICQSIVRSHSGRLWAERGRDGGAKFSLVLPIYST